MKTFNIRLKKGVMFIRWAWRWPKFNDKWFFYGKKDCKSTKPHECSFCDYALAIGPLCFLGFFMSYAGGEP